MGEMGGKLPVFLSLLFTNPMKYDRIFTYENSWKKRVHLHTALQRNPVW